MAQLFEASGVLKLLTERLNQYKNREQQIDIDSAQELLNDPLFQTFYNLQESFELLKSEYEKGNNLIKNCLFQFDSTGRLKLIPDNKDKFNKDNNDRLSDNNIVRRIILNKQTSNISLGITLTGYKHHQLDINAIFIEDIQLKNDVHVDGRISIGDQVVAINNFFFNCRDSTILTCAQEILLNKALLSFELIVISQSFAYFHEAVSTKKNDGHSSEPTFPKSSYLDMVLNTLWTQIEVIELNNDGSGLGFGISGNKSTGVVVKAIVPGSIVDKDGRIRTGDHLFQINHVCVRGMSSEQVAGILRQCSQQVRIVVARSVREPTSTTSTKISDITNSTSVLMSERISLTENTINKEISTNADVLSSANCYPAAITDQDGIINASKNKILLRTELLLENNHNLEKILENLQEQCHHEDGTEILDVVLEKGEDGLGITVAGYVSPDSTNNDAIAGIFIREITPESVTARDGRLAVGDQIIEVNEQSLNGFSNVQALYLLQNTSSNVQLKVRRYLDGLKHNQIKEMIELQSVDRLKEKLDFPLSIDIHEKTREKWNKVLGNNYDILIANIYKPDNCGFGITLEGTVDIENGEEVRPHHYIRALLRDGPVASEGTLKSGDELLEVNNQILYGKNHIHVIEILKRVKHQVVLVCARRRELLNDEVEGINACATNRSRSISFGTSAEIVVKAKSMGTLNSDKLPINLLSSSTRTINMVKSRSLEVISDLALWSKTIIHVELRKGDNGLGFSVLDYQDPSNPSHSPVIVIRALVPGGVAQSDGRVVPGDRLVAVNDITLENMTLDDVIQILKSTPKGPVKLSLSKPLPYPKFKTDAEDKTTTDTDSEYPSNQDPQKTETSNRMIKSQTASSMIQNNKDQSTQLRRSTSTRCPSRSSNSKRTAVSAGITLSAPAILSQHEYIQSLLDKESMRDKVEPRASSTGRTHRRKILQKHSSIERKSSKLQAISPLTSEQHFDLLRRKDPRKAIEQQIEAGNRNLPEFLNFQSDHLLSGLITSRPLNDRSRGSSPFSTSKFNRQSANQNTINPLSSPTKATTILSTSSSRSNHSTGKRSSRSRQAHDTTIGHLTSIQHHPKQKHQEQQERKQQQTNVTRPSSLPKMTNKHDSMTPFNKSDLSLDEDQQQPQQLVNAHLKTQHNNHQTVENNVLPSSGLDHPQPINNVPSPATFTTLEKSTLILDEDAHEVDTIIKKHQQTITNPDNQTKVDDNDSVKPAIKTPTTPTLTSRWTSSRQPSRMASPALSTSSQSSGRVITFLNHEVIQLPVYSEREIRVKCNFDQLSLVVDAYVDEGVNGCYVRSVATTLGATNRNTLRPGDYVLSINNENMKKISNAQARSIIRRASLIGSDISVIFIPGDEAKQFKDHALDPQTISSPIPPEIADSELETSESKSNTMTIHQNDHSDLIDSQQNHCNDSNLIDSEALSATLWGPPRTVTLYRDEDAKSLGISIVGGKLDFSGPGNTIESCISGIFIKHVIPHSPAGRNGILKTGDRILEVNGHDLRDASHDRAVEIIRAAQSPVQFVFQSLNDPTNPLPSSDDSPLINNFPNIPNISPANTKTLNTAKPSVGNERKTEEELIKQYGHLQGDLLLIDVRRSLSEINEPLGLSLIGHRDPNKLAVFVCDIQTGSLLDRDHRLRPADQLLEVNGEILLGKAHSAVTPIIKSIKADILNFVVLRNPNAINDMALNNQHAAAVRLRASAMASSSPEHSIASPILLRSQQPSSLLQNTNDEQMRNDPNRHHPINNPSLSPDVNENKEKAGQISPKKLISNPEQTSETNEPSSNNILAKVSISQTTESTIPTVKDDKLVLSEEKPSSVSSLNQIIRTDNVQSHSGNNKENDVVSFDHNIDRNRTTKTFHPASSDTDSSTQRLVESTVNQRTHAYENDGAPHLFSPPSLSSPSSLFMDEQAMHANDASTKTKNQTENERQTMQANPDDHQSQSTKSSNIDCIDDVKDDSSCRQSQITQSNQTNSPNKQTSPSDVMPSSPITRKTDDRIDESTIVKTESGTTNGATVSHMPLSSSSSSSSSTSSVSTPSSNEHVSKRKLSTTLSQLHRRASVSTPGAPITLVLSKDQKGSFGLNITQRDQAFWIQSVLPHGAADQHDIRAGDQLLQVNGTPVDTLKLTDVQNMLEHSNSNQIHLTCVPYREPQPQPVVVNINQAESLPTLVQNDTETVRNDDPTLRPILVGQETYIEIDRGQSGLGLSVVGGCDTQLSAIIVHDIYDGCAAQRDGRLHVGDQILEVNSIDLRMATHDEAIQALRQSTNVVSMLILRGKALNELTNEQEKFDIISIDLIKKSGKGLGFSIIGRRHGHGVFISHILEGGCAEKDGRLMSGDLILEVNGQDLRSSAYEHVAYTLKTLPHGRVTIKIGRLKASSHSQMRQNSLPHDRKNRSRSSSSNLRRSSANKINDR